MLNIDIIYHNPAMPELEFIEGKSDWIDLRASVGGSFKAGDFAYVDLGVSMRLPEGYEAHIIPRSSTFKNYGIIQANSIGVVDNSYSGTNDVWKMPCYFIRDSIIQPNDRICQFRLVKKMTYEEDVKFNKVTELDNVDRGGLGSTGK